MYKALIVDDEPMICEGLKELIDWETYGFSDISTACDGESALDSIKHCIPDLLITDIRMPKMNGIELLKNIRERELDIRVIVLSGYDDFEYIRSMAVLGIENYLLKPVNEDEIRLTILNVVKKLEKRMLQQQQVRLNINVIRENIINRWINGSISENELEERAAFLELKLDAEYYQPCILKIFGDSLKKNYELKNKIYNACEKILSENQNCYVSQNYDGDTISLFWGDNFTEKKKSIVEVLIKCTEMAVNSFEVHLYAFMGEAVYNYWEVSGSLEDAIKRATYVTKTPDMSARQNIQDNDLSPFSLKLAYFVQNNYNKDLSLKLLATQYNGNAAYIGQLFKRDFGEPFSEYLKKVRIEKSKELLKNNKYNVKEISAKVGFQNETYFNAVFKKSTGLSPLEYKKLITENGNL